MRHLQLLDEPMPVLVGAFSAFNPIEKYVSVKTQSRRFGTPFHLEPKHVVSRMSAVN